MEQLPNWILPLAAVAALAGATVGFALWIGEWIDAQSNSVVDEPRPGRKRKREDD